MISKALVTGVYQKKTAELARFPDLELRVVVPPFWRENRVGDIQFTRQYASGYDLQVEPMRFNGQHHIHYYPGIDRQFKNFRPDLVHIDEEPYNLVSAHATWQARKLGAKTIFFSWQNLLRRYPLPFRWIEQYCYRTASAALVGNQDARRILRQKGFRRPISVIPQFGVDPGIYQAKCRTDAHDSPVVGYIGRIVPEKGIDTIIEAIAKIPSRPELRIVGSGDFRARLESLAEDLGVRDRVRFTGPVPGEEVPQTLAEFDMLVLPSRTRDNWKEQFGRILTEAMACQTPVIGSDSGEIPHVIGAAGLTFPEGDAGVLAQRIQSLIEQPDRAAELGRAGRQRVLERFTQERIAQQTHAVYRKVLDMLDLDSA